MIDPEQLKQLIVEALWLSFLRRHHLDGPAGSLASDQEERPMTDNRVEAVGNFPDERDGDVPDRLRCRSQTL